MSRRAFISAGEASGDALGAVLVRELRALDRSSSFQAIGGMALASEAELVVDSSSWGAVGIGQSLRVAPRAASGLAKAKRALAEGEPGLFIPIDFGFFNVRLARFAKEKGWKVLYFMPPGSWRRDKQGSDLPSITDAVVTPFPWSAEILQGMDANAHFFGHPLKQLVRGVAKAGVGSGVAVLPGSRRHEIDLNLKTIADALPKEVPAEFAVAPNVGAALLEQRWRVLAPYRHDDRFTTGDTHGVLRRARAAIVCSGTATLEAALLHCPMAVLYRVSIGTVLQARLAGFKPRWIALPNLVLERDAVPEFVGRDIAANDLRATIERLLEDGRDRESQLKAFDEIDALLGPDDAITKTAELAVSMLKLS